MIRKGNGLRAKCPAGVCGLSNVHNSSLPCACPARAGALPSPAARPCVRNTAILWRCPSSGICHEPHHALHAMAVPFGPLPCIHARTCNMYTTYHGGAPRAPATYNTWHGGAPRRPCDVLPSSSTIHATAVPSGPLPCVTFATKVIRAFRRGGASFGPCRSSAMHARLAAAAALSQQHCRSSSSRSSMAAAMAAAAAAAVAAQWRRRRQQRQQRRRRWRWRRQQLWRRRWRWRRRPQQRVSVRMSRSHSHLTSSSGDSQSTMPPPQPTSSGNLPSTMPPLPTPAASE